MGRRGGWSGKDAQRPCDLACRKLHMPRTRYSRILSVAGALGVTAFLTARLLAKHPSNAGPPDPPIKFPLPPPEPLTGEQEMKTFKLAPGMKLELAAAEPLVEDPIQIAFDERGRMWVVELRGYMHGLEGEG